MSDSGRDDLAPGPAYLSIGSNVGDRETLVCRAVDMLERLGCARSLRLSDLYETEPVDCGSQPRFVNAVAELQPLLCIADLLKRTKEIEKRLGRVGGHNEPREVDIDIIAFGNLVMNSDELAVPHPRYRDRAFVLVPLSQVAPHFVCPATGTPVRDLLSRLPEGVRGVTRISSRRVLFQ